MSSGPMPFIAIVGAGAAGTSFALSLEAAGWPAALVTREAVAAADHRSLLATAPVVVFAVRDAQIGPLAVMLSARLGWKDRIAVHLSGLQPSSILKPLADAQAAICSLHPLVSLGPAPDGTARPIPRGTPFFGEGDAAALGVARRLALAVDGTFHEIPTETKALYHAAATVAGNLVAILHAAAGRALRDAGVPEAERALLPLARASIEAVALHQGLSGLSGPLVRDDVETLEANIGALAAAGPTLMRAHAATSLLGLELLAQIGLAPAHRREMEELLRAVLADPAIGSGPTRD
jgi:predicted short-subunit dehydrogenase-like oxidoreductase (DUF2520 family)